MYSLLNIKLKSANQNILEEDQKEKNIDIDVSQIIYFKQSQLDQLEKQIIKYKNRITEITNYIQKIKQQLVEEDNIEKQNLLIEIIDNLKYSLDKLKQIYSQISMFENQLQTLVKQNENQQQTIKEIIKENLDVGQILYNLQETLQKINQQNNKEFQKSIDEKKLDPTKKKHNVPICTIHNAEQQEEINQSKKAYDILINLIEEKKYTHKQQTEMLNMFIKNGLDIDSMSVSTAVSEKDQFIQKLQKNIYNMKLYINNIKLNAYKIIQNQESDHISEILYKHSEYEKQKITQNQENGYISESLHKCLEHEKQKPNNPEFFYMDITNLNNNILIGIKIVKDIYRQTLLNEIQEDINSYKRIHILNKNEQKNFIEKVLVRYNLVYNMHHNIGEYNPECTYFSKLCVVSTRLSNLLMHFQVFILLSLFRMLFSLNKFFQCVKIFQKIDYKIKQYAIYEKHQNMQQTINNYIKTNLEDFLYQPTELSNIFDNFFNYYQQKKDSYQDCIKIIERSLFKTSKNRIKHNIKSEIIDGEYEPNIFSINNIKQFKIDILNPLCKKILLNLAEAEETKQINTNYINREIFLPQFLPDKPPKKNTQTKNHPLSEKNIKNMKTKPIRSLKNILQQDHPNYLAINPKRLLVLFESGNMANEMTNYYNLNADKFFYNLINLLLDPLPFIKIKTHDLLNKDILKKIIIEFFQNHIVLCYIYKNYHNITIDTEFIIEKMSILTIFYKYLKRIFTNKHPSYKFCEYYTILLKKIINISNNNVKMSEEILKHINNILFETGISKQNNQSKYIEINQELEELKNILINIDLSTQLKTNINNVITEYYSTQYA